MKKYINESRKLQLMEWLGFYRLRDTDTALPRAIKKVFKGTSPEEQEKILKEYEEMK